MKCISVLTANVVLLLGIANYCFGVDLVSEERGIKLYQAGCNYETARQTAQASKCYIGAISECPDGNFVSDAKLLLSRLNAIAYIKSKDFVNADAEIKTNAAAFEKKPGYEWYLYSVGCEYETAKQEEQAKKYYSQVVAKFPNGNCFSGAKLSLSRLNVLSYIRSNNFAKAETEIQSNSSVFENKPGYEWYLYSIGCEYETAKQDEQARKYYSQTVAKFPNGNYAGDAKLSLSRLNVLAYIRSGDFAKAETEIQSNATAFENKPGYEWYLISVGSEYETAKQEEQAKKYYSQAVEKFPNGKCSEGVRLSLSRLNVLSYIESKDFARAEAEIQANAAFENNPAYEWYLFSVATWYDDFGKLPQQARKYFSQVASKFPAGNCAKIAALRVMAIDAASLMGVQDSTVQETVKKIRSDYVGYPETCNMILYIAEKYYEKGIESSIDSRESYFKNSLAILQDGLGASNLSNSMVAEFSYMAGLNLQTTGDYTKAAQAFENSYQADPNFIYADYCLFAQGLCYEKLLEQKLVSEVESKALTKCMYEELLRTYPESKGVSYARTWLKNNPE